MTLKEFDIASGRIPKYIITLAQAGKTAEKLEKRTGLPRKRFRVDFKYPKKVPGHPNESYDLKKFAEGEYIHTHLRIKNFPDIWIETSKGLFIPYEEKKALPKKQRELFNSLEGLLKFGPLEISVPEYVSDIERDLIQVPYNENKLQLYFGPSASIRYV
ncbi:MAG: hypothetical protein PVJ67_04540 [Candidatus Pacearchaeota archaeon]|jgi:hypothetical protein